MHVGRPIGLVLVALWGLVGTPQRSARLRLCSRHDSLHPLTIFFARELWNDHVPSVCSVFLLPASVHCVRRQCAAGYGARLRSGRPSLGAAPALEICNAGSNAWVMLCRPTEASRARHIEQFERAIDRARAKTVERQCQLVREPCLLACCVLLRAGACTHAEPGRRPRCLGKVCARQPAFPNSSSVYTFQRGGGFVGEEDWAEGEACPAALARSNCSLLARAAHTQRARPLPPPSFPEPQRDALGLPFDHSLQGGEAERLCRSHRPHKEK